MKLHKRAVADWFSCGSAHPRNHGLVAAVKRQGNGPASALSGLVSDGTLTQAQADKVAEALKAQREAIHKERQAKPGGDGSPRRQDFGH